MVRLNTQPSANKRRVGMQTSVCRHQIQREKNRQQCRIHKVFIHVLRSCFEALKFDWLHFYVSLKLTSARLLL